MASLTLVQFGPGDPSYPSGLRDCLGPGAPVSIIAMGALEILKQEPLALFCSVKCPGRLILETYDLAARLRHAGVTVISGFHSPMEKECLVQLLRGKQPVIACPARSLDRMRVPAEHRQALEQGRLLYLTPFTGNERHSTAEMAVYRNRFAAALASRVFVAYAEPGGKTEAFCREVISWDKPLYTLDDEAKESMQNNLNISWASVMLYATWMLMRCVPNTKPFPSGWTSGRFGCVWPPTRWPWGMEESVW